MLHRVNLMHPS